MCPQLHFCRLYHYQERKGRRTDLRDSLLRSLPGRRCRRFRRDRPLCRSYSLLYNLLHNLGYRHCRCYSDRWNIRHPIQNRLNRRLALFQSRFQPPDHNHWGYKANAADVKIKRQLAAQIIRLVRYFIYLPFIHACFSRWERSGIFLCVCFAIYMV